MLVSWACVLEIYSFKQKWYSFVCPFKNMAYNNTRTKLRAYFKMQQTNKQTAIVFIIIDTWR